MISMSYICLSSFFLKVSFWGKIVGRQQLLLDGNHGSLRMQCLKKVYLFTVQVFLQNLTFLWIWCRSIRNFYIKLKQKALWWATCMCKLLRWMDGWMNFNQCMGQKINTSEFGSQKVYKRSLELFIHMVENMYYHHRRGNTNLVRYLIRYVL